MAIYSNSHIRDLTNLGKVRYWCPNDCGKKVVFLFEQNVYHCPICGKYFRSEKSRQRVSSNNELLEQKNLPAHHAKL